ncbi:MAG: hypothetical protein AAGM67_10840, partial [Bacteroidota bacterium]
FGTQTTWTNCYSHLVRNIFLKKKALFSSVKNLDEMKRDIASLHEETSKKKFENLYSKFFEKWQNIEIEATRILQREYSKGWAANFHIGATGIPGFPSSNNGLEGKNRWIKDQGTFRSLGGFADFISDMSQYLRQESTMLKPFKQQPQVPATLWRKAQLLLAESWDFFHRIESGTIYVLSLNGLEKVKLEQGKARQKKKFLELLSVYKEYLSQHENPEVSFDTMVEVSKNIYELKGLNEPAGEHKEISFECSCPAFYSKWVCKHSLAYSIAQRKTDVPADRSMQLIGKNRERGQDPSLSAALTEEKPSKRKRSKSNR